MKDENEIIDFLNNQDKQRMIDLCEKCGAETVTTTQSTNPPVTKQICPVCNYSKES